MNEEFMRQIIAEHANRAGASAFSPDRSDSQATRRNTINRKQIYAANPVRGCALARIVAIKTHHLKLSAAEADRRFAKPSKTLSSGTYPTVWHYLKSMPPRSVVATKSRLAVHRQTTVDPLQLPPLALISEALLIFIATLLSKRTRTAGESRAGYQRPLPATLTTTGK
ncbi:hypothetical protein [Thiohalophilus sp.]|uniref:hypothetical protein n=1 Tax=Thiohalophilus sp. TaxID=3028392 RepID=UPI002ACE8EB4|nr:hypothetical protein [Thiohalophilus sp.]MDZ7804308.1 hypothetical protein [Thiohalophilus sp.]